MSLENTIKDNKIKNKMSLLGKALSTAGIVYLGLFGGACKTNNTVEPEPVKPAIQITGTVYNETTGERGIPNVTLEVEANDTLYITAKGEVDPSQSNGFNWFGVQVLENGEVVDGVVTEGGIDYTDNQVKDLVEMKGKYEVNRYYNGKTYNMGVEYDTYGSTTEGFKYVPFGPTIHQNPEKDYLNIANSYNISKNKKEELATILSDNSVVAQNGQHLTYEQMLSGLKRTLDGDEGNFETKNVSIYDISGNSGNYNAGAIVFNRTDGYRDAFFTNSEATMYKLKKLYGVK